MWGVWCLEPDVTDVVDLVHNNLLAASQKKNKQSPFLQLWTFYCVYVYHVTEGVSVDQLSKLQLLDSSSTLNTVLQCPMWTVLQLCLSITPWSVSSCSGINISVSNRTFNLCENTLTHHYHTATPLFPIETQLPGISDGQVRRSNRNEGQHN